MADAASLCASSVTTLPAQQQQAKHASQKQQQQTAALTDVPITNGAFMNGLFFKNSESFDSFYVLDSLDSLVNLSWSRAIPTNLVGCLRKYFVIWELHRQKFVQFMRTFLW